MKKAFDQNVSRARPRVRLGSAAAEVPAEAQLQVEEMARAIANEPAPVIPDLAHAVRARAAESREPKASAVQTLRTALAEAQAAEAEDRAVPEPLASPMAKAPEPHAAPTPYVAIDAPRGTESPPFIPSGGAPFIPSAVEGRPVAMFKPEPRPVAASTVASFTSPPVAVETRPLELRSSRAEDPRSSRAESRERPRASFEPPPQVVEVQSPKPPLFDQGPQDDVRRERLKERLKAVRENPRPEPLPETVAEAGVLAVERISALQTEVTKVRSLNLALSQDLEAQRRQSERATEEARLRMDEARRLAGEMDTRAKLLADLERELASLEGERNESLLALQEARSALDSGEGDKEALRHEIGKRDAAIAESLAEEERLASELESAHEASSLLRRSVDSLRQERDTLARQVSDLTRERAELLEARKALEAVHRALSQAVAR